MPTAADKLLLAADVGGTKTLLQLFTSDRDTHLTPLAEQRYQSGTYDTLEALVQHFLDEVDQGLPHSACFAVAGPVQQRGNHQSASLTNLPWQLDSGRMSDTLGIAHIALVNDFQAIGYSLDELGEEERVTLNPADGVNGGPRLVVGAGTGLGVCTLFPDNGRYLSYPSEGGHIEGGHIAFAPRGNEQEKLLQFMQQEHPRVSYERLVSGTGLVNIYRYLLQRDAIADETLLSQDDPAAAIGGQAQDGHPLATEAVRLFCRIYGAFTGDMALNILPTGGIYIAGGIAPKLLSNLQDGSFMEAYLDKGRMQDLVRGFPVQVITNARCGLLGAAHYAARL
jgi:glucokinase